MSHTSRLSASVGVCSFGENRLSSGSAESKRRAEASCPLARVRAPSGGKMRIRPENSAGDAGKDKRASKAFSTRLCAKNKARPLMGMDWKILRGRKGAIKSPWPLCADDGGCCLGQTAGVPEPDKRNWRISADVTDEFQGIRHECVPAAAPQEMEGLNRQNYNRTYPSVFGSGFRWLELRDLTRDRLAAIPRQQDPGWTVEERCESSAVGLECRFQNGCE